MCKRKAFLEGPVTSSASRNRDKQKASGSFLNNFANDALTISAGSLSQMDCVNVGNGGYKMVGDRTRSPGQMRVKFVGNYMR